jgi:hypothetical protein
VLSNATKRGGTGSRTDPCRAIPFWPPDTRKRRDDGSKMLISVRRFDWGTAEVNLIAEIPSLRDQSRLSVTYQLQ